jgi:hypothetical protein
VHAPCYSGSIGLHSARTACGLALLFVRYMWRSTDHHNALEKRWKASKCGHSTFEEQSAEKRRKYRPTKAPANERRIAGHE